MKKQLTSVIATRNDRTPLHLAVRERFTTWMPIGVSGSWRRSLSEVAHGKVALRLDVSRDRPRWTLLALRSGRPSWTNCTWRPLRTGSASGPGWALGAGRTDGARRASRTGRPWGPGWGRGSLRSDGVQLYLQARFVARLSRLFAIKIKI